METIFSISNALVLPFWAMMLLLPRWRWTERIVSSPLVAAAPAALYLALVLPRLGELLPVLLRPELETVARLLGTPEAATIAWAHFLAFDLFVGRWIYLEAAARGVSAWVTSPILFATLMLGPVGFLLWLAVRATAGGARAGHENEARGPEPETGGPAGPAARAAARGLVAAARGFVAELWRRDPALFAVAAFHAALFVLFAALAQVDGRTILGIDPWIKPMKFASSIAIYLWTMGWLLAGLPLSDRARRVVRWSLAGPLLVEIALIAMQSARGTTSHFNAATPFDAAVFGAMGLAIFYVTFVNLYLLVRFWRTPAAGSPAYAWGVRLGLLLFLFGSAQGGYMVGASAHTVGAPDGGAGLPFVNWSTAYGDLRVAHFLGLHALQALPLAGWAIDSMARRGLVRRPGLALAAVSAAYAVATAGAFALALLGLPLVRS